MDLMFEFNYSPGKQNSILSIHCKKTIAVGIAHKPFQITYLPCTMGNGRV
jgi:hypothetical protein